MKIVSYKKKKNNIYEITLSNKNKISLYDDVILKYELLLKKEIKEDELSHLLKENLKLESYYVALKYLNIKLRTEKEIRKKLSNYDKDIVDNTIKLLKKDKYINDELYIKSYINDQINLKLIGPLKIVSDLKKLGFKENDITNYLNTFNKDIWYEKIDKYISKKISTNHNLSSYMLKQKIIKDLITKGFYNEDINLCLGKYEFIDDNDIYEKEYDKIKRRLSKKYEGELLEYQVKNYLYRKGFRK